jgi:hypothetical protein
MYDNQFLASLDAQICVFADECTGFVLGYDLCPHISNLDFEDKKKSKA